MGWNDEEGYRVPMSSSGDVSGAGAGEEWEYYENIGSSVSYRSRETGEYANYYEGSYMGISTEPWSSNIFEYGCSSYDSNSSHTQIAQNNDYAFVEIERGSNSMPIENISWEKGMTPLIKAGSEMYVVSNQSNKYTNINDVSLRNQFINQLHERGATYRGHPLDVQLSGDFWMLADVWARLNVPFTIPDPRPNKSMKQKRDNHNREQKMYYYRKEGIIK